MDQEDQGVDPLWNRIVGEESGLGMARLMGLIACFIALGATVSWLAF